MKQEKKYLKTIEEVSDALAAGKVVYDSIGREYKKDRNGFVIGKVKSGARFLNTILDTDYYPYILEPKPLEVNLWHLYEDKSGRKVLIGGKYIDDVPYPFCGMVENVSSFIFYNKNGKSWEINNHYDLVKEIADLSKYFE